MTAQERRKRERLEREQSIVRVARSIAETEGWPAVTTRRLASEIEYSQPVLYEHFAGRDGIIAAAALEGFAELAGQVRQARLGASTAEEALVAVARSYDEFATSYPALYEAMFTMGSELRFAQPDTPDTLKAAFNELLESIEPFAGPSDADTFAEVFWSALHGLAVLRRSSRLDPRKSEERLTLLIKLLAKTTG